MRNKGIWKILAISVILAIVTCSVAVFSAANLGIGEKGIEEGGGKDVISLVAPPFIGVAGASESEVSVMREGTNFLEEEAGISAYTNVGMEIDIEKAKVVYRTIEVEKENYTIGSVALPGYGESEDVHVYVHKDGWIVAYYLKDEPVAKIIDWLNYKGAQMPSTQLENAIGKMCDGVGVPLIETKYYDFGVPNANRLMIVADAQWEEGWNSFKIKIPSGFAVYKKSWSHYACNSDGSKLELDGSIINTFGECDGYWILNYGKIRSAQLKLDIFHTISLWHQEWYWMDGEAFCGIVLVYREA